MPFVIAPRRRSSSRRRRNLPKTWHYSPAHRGRFVSGYRAKYKPKKSKSAYARKVRRGRFAGGSRWPRPLYKRHRRKAAAVHKKKRVKVIAMTKRRHRRARKVAANPRRRRSNARRHRRNRHRRNFAPTRMNSRRRRRNAYWAEKLARYNPRRRRRNARRHRRNPFARHHRRHRRNPIRIPLVGGFLGKVGDKIVPVLGGIGGLAFAWHLPALAAKAHDSLGRGWGAVGTAAVGTYFASKLVSRMSPALGEKFLLGGFMGAGILALAAISGDTRRKLLPVEDATLQASLPTFAPAGQASQADQLAALLARSGASGTSMRQLVAAENAYRRTASITGRAGAGEFWNETLPPYAQGANRMKAQLKGSSETF